MAIPRSYALDAMRMASTAVWVLTCLSAAVISGIALFSSRWLVMEIKHIEEVHYHGLWWDCRQTGSADQICTYKWDHSSSENGGGDAKQHDFHDRHLFTFLLLSVSVLIGASALVTIICGGLCRRVCYTVATLLTFIAALTSSLAVIGFLVASNQMNVRIVWDVERYNQTRGDAFDMALVGCILNIIGLIAAGLSTVLSFKKPVAPHRLPHFPNNITTNQHLPLITVGPIRGGGGSSQGTTTSTIMGGLPPYSPLSGMQTQV